MQHVVSQLISKKEELNGKLAYHRSKILQLQEIVDSIDISIQVFEAEFNVEDIKVKRYSDRQTYFRHGESFTMILDSLRKAETSLTTNEITIELMKKKKLDYKGYKLVDKVQKTILV